MANLDFRTSAKIPVLHRSIPVNRPHLLRGVSIFDFTLAKTNTGDKQKTMKSKLFLVAIAALIMGAFAIVGCEPAAAPTEEGTSASGEASTDVETPKTDNGDEAKSEEATKSEGEMGGTEGEKAEGEKTEGTTTEPTHTEGDTHTEGEGH